MIEFKNTKLKKLTSRNLVCLFVYINKKNINKFKGIIFSLTFVQSSFVLLFLWEMDIYKEYYHQNQICSPESQCAQFTFLTKTHEKVPKHSQSPPNL